MPWSDVEDLDDDELAWVAMQLAIDGGLHWCTRCDEGGYHRFCGSCGQRFIGHDREWRKCSVCHAIVPTRFCSHCGFNVDSQFLRDVMAGRVDWGARVADAAKSVSKIHKMLGLAGGDAGGRKRTILDAVRETFRPKVNG